ncbi:hypothetical protein MP478_02395 [Chryseobacterium sp. WG14]|uniref:hypothetical protein n=1 Tax=unclassified Chryseobacterium TaxID=2593645 RepID=UPI00211F08A6|nr:MULTISPECIES: hypothetical protein [unclassified Chryseobacterium]MCQ9634028.1 hypothetical protein [Chryseobacterium sp. WG23]MCQ9638224.1 hypothetical protein [Chryseobacterium sp. WG14]
MNIDELKNTWNEDITEVTPEISIEQRNKINLPLEKMRKNMRQEFWWIIGIFIFAFMVCSVCRPFKLQLYITVLIASMLIVTVFFFSKFFKLYNEISNTELKTYEALKDLVTQFNLNKQYYLSYYISFAPFLVCEILIVLEFIPWPKPLSEAKIAIILIGSVIAGLFVLFLSGRLWFYRYYGRHIQHIEGLLNELKK